MSFNFLGTFRKGSYMEFRRFVTNEIRNVRPRMSVIEVELQRIGEVEIIWHIDDNGFVTERRKGFRVPVGTSIGKLMQAYIGLGGNPFDISMFLRPKDQDGQPSQGAVHHVDRDDSASGVGTQAQLSTLKDPASRTYYRVDPEKEKDIAKMSIAARQWCNQEIRQKRNNVEWQILKLCDLAEQLRHEKDTLIKQAVGNVLSEIEVTPGSPLAEDLTLQQIFRTLDGIVFEKAEDGFPDQNWAYNTNNTKNTGYLNIYNDFDDEKWTAL